MRLSYLATNLKFMEFFMPSAAPTSWQRRQRGHREKAGSSAGLGNFLNGDLMQSRLSGRDTLYADSYATTTTPSSSSSPFSSSELLRCR